MTDRYTTVLVTTASGSFYQAIHRLDWFKEIESLKKQGAISIVIAKQFGVGGHLYTDNINKQRTETMNAMYIPYDGNDFLTGEIVFESDKFTHIMIDGTDTIAVLPTEDIYPS